MFSFEKLRELGARPTENGLWLTDDFCFIRLLKIYQENNRFQHDSQIICEFLIELEKDLGICHEDHACQKVSVIPFNETQKTSVAGMEYSIPNVPASRCENCGEITYDMKAMKYIEIQERMLKEQISKDRFRVFSYPDKAELWSTKRMSYDPRGWERLMRDELYRAVNVICTDAFTEFYFQYTAEDRSSFDLENVLTYNVGLGAFRDLHPHRLLMERSFDKTKTNSPQLSIYPIYQEYETVIPEKTVWNYKETVAFWDTKLAPVRTDLKPAVVWQKVKSGYLKLVQIPSLTDHLGIKLHLTVPDLTKFQLFYVLKVLIDGTVAAFHSYNGNEMDEVAERLSVSLRQDQQSIRDLLLEQEKAVLGARRLVFPYRGGVMWNPSDDRLVHIDIELTEAVNGDEWRYSGELFTVEENGHD